MSDFPIDPKLAEQLRAMQAAAELCDRCWLEYSAYRNAYLTADEWH